MSDTCHLCGKPEFIDVSGLCRTIQQCQICDEYVCSECASVDYDYAGEEDGYRNTQWICPNGCAPIATYSNRGKAA